MSDDRQKMIGVRVDDALLAEIDRVRGSMSRSEFVRRATYEALKAMGSDLPPSVIAAPDRAGKGGPKPTMQARENPADYRAKSKAKPKGNDPK